MNISEKEVREMILQDRDFRLSIVKRDLFFFTLYYLGHYFQNLPAKFHYDICSILTNDEINNAMFIMFRGSAKTTFVKADFLRNIAFGLRKLMFWSSADGNSSSDNLFDVATNLQTNKRFIADFGELFFGESEETLRTSKKTSIGNFKTTNGVRVLSTAIGGSLRGKNFDGSRIDYIVFDDIETNVTIRSSNITNKTINYIDEALTAVAPNYKAIVLGNRISDTGVIAYLEEKFGNDKKFSIVYEKAAIENGKSSWTDRFLLTDKEYDIYKKRKLEQGIPLDEINILSLESIKRQVNTNGRKVFEQEYLNQPMVDGDRFFNVELIDKLIVELKNKPRITEGKWTYWKGLEKLKNGRICKYIMGVDISQGYGIDHSVIEVWNIDTNEQVAEYCNNLAPPEILVGEIIKAHKKYNQATIIPENNSIGASVISLLKDKGYASHMPVQVTFDKIKNVKIQKFGWNTNGSSKPKMIFDLQTDFNEQNIKVNSIMLLKELRTYTNGDLGYSSFDPEASNHFDRIIATAIMNQHRLNGTGFYLQKTGKKYTQNKEIPKSDETTQTIQSRIRNTMKGSIIKD